ncbi:MAG: PIN domain-containing protein [Verrucomicrobia bacterium]|nr:PIN domain-containing protein [Verrucomicrobiota bacterium]
MRSAGVNQVVRLPLARGTPSNRAVERAELHFGAHRSPNPARNLERIERFVNAVVLVPVDATTAALYGQLKAELMTAGQIIPDNDLWIAALAKQHDLMLVSRDQHFGHVLGLKWVVW